MAYPNLSRAFCTFLTRFLASCVRYGIRKRAVEAHVYRQAGVPPKGIDVAAGTVFACCVMLIEDPGLPMFVLPGNGSSYGVTRYFARRARLHLNLGGEQGESLFHSEEGTGTEIPFLLATRTQQPLQSLRLLR